MQDEFFASPHLIDYQNVIPNLRVQSYYNSTAFVFSDKAIEKLFILYPDIQQALKQSLYPQLDSLFYFLFARSLHNVTQKAASIILYFKQRFSMIHTADCYTLTVPLSHRMIAEFLNISRETVTKAMLQLTNLGLIVYTDNKFIHIPSVKALRKWMLA